MCPGVLKNTDSSSAQTPSIKDLKLLLSASFLSLKMIGIVNPCKKAWGVNLILRDVSGGHENQLSGPSAVKGKLYKKLRLFRRTWEVYLGKIRPSLNKGPAAGGSSLWSTDALGRTGTDTRQQMDLKIIANNYLCLELNSQWIKMI